MNRYSYLDHLECSRCGSSHEAGTVQSVCACGAPLLARYDLEALAEVCRPADLTARPASLWRYHELLPVSSEAGVISLGEAVTPTLRLPRLGEEMGLERLSLKDEGLLPTGTFKARGAAVGVSRARELGVTRIAMPTNGNAGAAWAAYGARAGIECLIVMPQDAPRVPRAECAIAGARLYLVDGHIGDAGAMVAEAIATQGYADASTLREPYRIEGKKTMGLELFEQLGWRAPDTILYPAGGGVGLIGIHKALRECQQLGWMSSRSPRMVAVQASGCAPVVKAWESGAAACEPWPEPATAAFGIKVPKPLGDFLILDALRSTDGCAVAVTDPEILSAQAELAGMEGLYICPEGAACIAAARNLRGSGWLHPDEEVVVINTGAGTLYSSLLHEHPPVLPRGARIPAS
ncbi:MAG: threonine synthase [Candidatus Dormibacteria bacterium]|jgi:threonine synthase